MYTLRDLGADVAYMPIPVESVVPTGRVEPVYTLSVEDPEHRYDAEGVISKNCAADIVNHVTLDMWDLLTGGKLPGNPKFILQIHDSLIYEIDEDAIDAFLAIQVEVMEQPFNLDGTKVVFPVDPGAGRNWLQEVPWDKKKQALKGNLDSRDGYPS